MSTLSPHLLLTRAIFALAQGRPAPLAHAGGSLHLARTLLAQPRDPRQSALILLTGSSGSGKTSLLRAMRIHLADRAPLPILNLSRPPATDHRKWSSLPLIDHIAQTTGMTWQAITQALTRLGLGQPALWTRPLRTLSDGERSRALLALHALMAIRESPAPVILIDEFLSILDRPTAHSILSGVRRVLSDHPGALLIAATAHDDLIKAAPPGSRMLRLGQCVATVMDVPASGAAAPSSA